MWTASIELMTVTYQIGARMVAMSLWINLFAPRKAKLHRVLAFHSALWLCPKRVTLILLRTMSKTIWRGG